MQGPFYGRYNTELAPDARRAFYEWLMNMSLAEGRNRFNDMNDYDMAGAYSEGAGQGDDGHFTDRYKKPNHPTFSDESIYHGADGMTGGKWGGNTFYPSEWNLKNMPEEQLRNYFEQFEPDASLNTGGATMIYDYTNKGGNSGGFGGGIWDYAAQAAGMIPGLQWVPAAYAGAKAVSSAANGDAAGAIRNGLSAFMGATGGATGGANATPSLDLTNTAKQSLSSLNPTSAAPTAGASPYTKDLAALNPVTSGFKPQSTYDAKFAGLSDMYGLKPGVSGSTGFNAEAARAYYNDDDVYNALQRMFRM